MTTIRKMLDISSDHIPRRLWAALENGDAADWGTIVNALPHGALLWVPDGPQDSNDLMDEDEQPAPEVLAVQLYARARGCDWVMLDVDADNADDLPIFDQDACPSCEDGTVSTEYCDSCGARHCQEHAPCEDDDEDEDDETAESDYQTAKAEGNDEP